MRRIIGRRRRQHAGGSAFSDAHARPYTDANTHANADASTTAAYPDFKLGRRDIRHLGYGH